MPAWDWSTRLRIRNHRSLLGYGMAETDNENGRCRCTFWYEHVGALPSSSESFNFEEGDSVQLGLGPSNLPAWLLLLSIIRTAALSNCLVLLSNNLQLASCKNALLIYRTPPDETVPQAMDSDST